MNIEESLKDYSRISQDSQGLLRIVKNLPWITQGLLRITQGLLRIVKDCSWIVKNSQGLLIVIQDSSMITHELLTNHYHLL